MNLPMSSCSPQTAKWEGRSPCGCSFRATAESATQIRLTARVSWAECRSPDRGLISGAAAFVAFVVGILTGGLLT